jgi:ethanolamine utilization cobalamin adenosyltransferase
MKISSARNRVIIFFERTSVVFYCFFTIFEEGSSIEKQEHMTSLSGKATAKKSDPRIEFRGRLDSLDAFVVAIQVGAKREGVPALVEKLEEIRLKVRDILTCEVTGKPCEDLSLWGLGSDEIRERSHHPEKYFGIGHILPHHTMGLVAATLNTLRTQVREAELSACRAFDRDGNGNEKKSPDRPDIIAALNRLSAAVYILIYSYLPDGYDKTIKFAG